MANVWTDCTAKSHGERELAATLAAISDSRLHLFFSIGFIPGAREIDLLLVHEDIGIFILEVKGVRLGGVVSVGPNEWVIEGRTTKENPILQAYQQYEGIRDFLTPHYPKLPFVAVSACLPKITRLNWRAAFSDSLYAIAIAESMLFEEDFYSGNPAFLDRLRYVHTNPPARQGREPRGVKPDFLALLRELVKPMRPHAPTLSERQKLRAIEQGITAKLQSDFPPDIPRHAVYTGLPGTGKTFRLLSIGAFHAFSKKRVLFVCFNKTLASDIRRLLTFSEKLQLAENQIEVLDINQLALRCFEMNGMGYVDSRDADEWGELLVEQLDGAAEPLVQSFDTILVDEAQDMKAWQLDLLERHLSKTSSIVMAVGQGQELYQDAASATNWLAAFTGRARIVSVVLRRNFRNPREQYFFAEAFYQAWPANFSEIEGCRKRLFARRTQEPLFERETGDAPKYLAVTVNPEEFGEYGMFQDDMFADTVQPILKGELDDLRNSSEPHPVGLLVLVPNQDGLHARAVRLSLERLCSLEDVGFIDYTKDGSRRASAAQHEIRLCTFHSARGLEAERVVVFGLEVVETIAESSGAKPENLAFIALSRGLFSTTIVVRSMPRNAVHALCEQILQLVRLTSNPSPNTKKGSGA